MHIPNFNFLDQFGEELCEEQTQKIRKSDQKTTYLGLLRSAMELRNRDLPKDTPKTPAKCTYPILASYLILEGRWEGTAIF